MRENDYKSPCSIGTALGLSYLCLFYDVWVQSPLTHYHKATWDPCLFPLSPSALLLLWNNERWLDYSISQLWFIEKISMEWALKVAGQQYIIFVVSRLSDHHAGCWNSTMTKRLNGCQSKCEDVFSLIIWRSSAVCEHFVPPCKSSAWRVPHWLRTVT